MVGSGAAGTGHHVGSTSQSGQLGLAFESWEGCSYLHEGTVKELSHTLAPAF